MQPGYFMQNYGKHPESTIIYIYIGYIGVKMWWPGIFMGDENVGTI